MNRTILYYPSIDILNSTWIKHALLYWDQISSIVPSDSYYSEEQPLDPDMAFLLEKDVYRPISPERLKNKRQAVREFNDELKSIVGSKSFKDSLGSKINWNFNFEIHYDKVTNDILPYLHRHGLAKETKDSSWLNVEQRTARVMMSILAKHIALSDDQFVTVGTDNILDENFAFGKSSEHEINGIPCLDIRFFDCLPLPISSVSYSDILEFKQRYVSELYALREVFSDLENELSQAVSNREIAITLVKFKEKAEREVINLKKALDGFGIAAIMGSAKGLMISRLPILLTSAEVARYVSSISSIPLSSSLGSVALVGSIEAALSIQKKVSDNRAKLRDSSFAYIYHAQSSGLFAH
ncbi:MAG: DUF6236 family protein [Thainema sp.]